MYSYLNFQGTSMILLGYVNVTHAQCAYLHFSRSSSPQNRGALCWIHSATMPPRSQDVWRPQGNSWVLWPGPAGGMLLFNHWSMGETGEGIDLDWWDDAVQVRENCGTVHGGAWVHLLLWWLGPVHCAGLDVSELHNNLLLFVYFSEHSWERGAVRCPGGKPTLCHIAYNRIPHHVEYLPSK